MENLTKAKAGLILDQPFFASLLLGMPIVPDASIPTFGTDGDSIRYNPEYLKKLTLAETTFVLAHETLHCVFQHMYTRGDRNHNRWNIAGDYIINDILKSERVGVMPIGGLYDPDIVKRGGGTTAGVYGLLPDTDNQKPSGQPGDGGSLDTVSDAGKDEAERSAKEADMRVKVIQAQNVAKMAGKLSAGIERLVKDITKPKADWRHLLRRFLSERAKLDLSYAKPKRRFLAEDIYLPSLIGERLGAVAIGVDCSGSIDAKTLENFAAEIRGIIQDAVPTEVRVIYFDSEVLHTDIFTADDDLKINPIGGGGTAFSPVFEELNKLENPPIACVMLTDLRCSDFGDVPSYPVLWASNDVQRAPFGEVIDISEAGE